MLETTARKRPRQLWTAIIALYLQAFLNAFAGILLVSLAEDDAPGMAILGYGSVVLALVLLASAVLLTRGVGWVRWPVVAIEAFGIISGAIALFSGVVTAVGGLVLSVLVLVNLFHADVRLWFDPVYAAVPDRPHPGDWVEQRVARVQHTSRQAGDQPLAASHREAAARLVQLGPSALGSARADVRAIGEELHRAGGVPLMRAVLHEAEVLSLCQNSVSILREVEMAWDNVGEWMG